MNRLTLFICVIITTLLGVSLYVVLEQTSVKKQDNSIHIVASFYPLAYIASQVGDGRVSVQTLTPYGAEPHDFDPTPRTIAELGKADMFLYNGAGFEPWITAWNKGSFARPREVIEMTSALEGRGVTLISGAHGVDPHVWLDPTVYAKEVEIVRDALIRLDPASAEHYTLGASHLIEKLVQLDGEYKAGLASCPFHTIIVSHEAFAYLAQAYGLSAVAIAGISPDEEPSPKTLAAIIDTARATKAHYIFFETTVSPKLSESIAREVGAETLVLNTLESLTLSEVQSGEDYIRIMQKNLTNLRTALLCI